jgi:hypothetical protein
MHVRHKEGRDSSHGTGAESSTTRTSSRQGGAAVPLTVTRSCHKAHQASGLRGRGLLIRMNAQRPKPIPQSPGHVHTQ